MQIRGQFDTGVDAGRHETALKRAEPGRPGRVRVRSRAARSLAAVLLAAVAALLALPLQAQAQTGTPLVSNTGQTQVRATNAEGDGAWSQSGTGTTTDARTPMVRTAAGLVFSPLTFRMYEGSDASYTVKLATQPTDTVTVTITGTAGTDLSLDKTSLTFTTLNWNVAQPVTVSADEDIDAVHDIVPLTHTASGGDYGSVTKDFEVFVFDLDDAALILTPVPFVIGEGEDLSYTVKLASQPTDTVTVTITGTTGTVLSLDKTSLTFTTLNWNVAQPVMLSAGEDDDARTASVPLTHTASGGDYESVSYSVTVNVRDNDERLRADLVIVPGSMSISEGTEVSLTVNLATQPTDTVTVTITGTTGTDLSLDKTSLTFTTLNWNVAQTVMLSAGEDNDTSNDTVVLTYTASGGDYGSVSTIRDVIVRDNDNITTGLILSPGTMFINEGSATNYTVRLASQPTDTVTVTITGTAGTDLSLDKTSLTFTTLTWNVAQTVRVSAGEDDDAKTDRETLRHTASGGNYTGLNEDLLLGVSDKDTKGLSLSILGTSLVEGDNFSFTVQLRSQPTDTVTVTITGLEGTDLSLDKTSLTFTTMNWNVVQPVMVSAGEDDDTVDDSETLTLGAAGGDYAGQSTRLSLSVIDNDDPPGVALSPHAFVFEEGTSADYKIKLTLQPTDTVTVTITGLEGTDLSLDKTSLTFTTLNWNVAQSVMLSAGEDDDTVDDRKWLDHTASGGGYDMVDNSFLALVFDNDRSVTISTTTLTVAEGGMATYTVVLDGQPTGTVTVTPSRTSGDTDVSVSGALTFTPLNWATPQVVTVTAGQDADGDEDTAVIGHTVGGDNFDGVTAASVDVTVDDDETASTEVILAVDPAWVNEGTALTRVRLTAELNEAPRSELTIVTVTVGASGDSAVEGIDYETIGDLTLTIRAGQTSTFQTILFRPVNTGIGEGDEGVSITGTTTAPGLTVVGTELAVFDDEITRSVTLSVVPETAAENGAPVTVAVRAMVDTGTYLVETPLTVTVGALEDSATEGTDYATAGDITITIPAGGTDGVGGFLFTPVDDSFGEGDEKISITGRSTGPTAVVQGTELTIVDDDTLSTEIGLSVSLDSLGEGAGSTTVTVTAELNEAPRSELTTVTVKVGATEDSAVAGTDYNMVNDFTLTIGAGQTTGRANFQLIPTDDAINEVDEALTVSGTTTATGLTVDTTSVTIVDNDAVGVTVSKTTLSVDEGGTATYTVVLDTQPADTVTVTIGGTSGTDVTVADSTLAFTTTDWSTAQTVTVTAAGDADALTDTVTLTHSATSTDSDYDGITIADVAVTVTEVTAPAKPTGLTATGGDEQVALAWDAPAATAAITHHEYRHKTALEEQYPETWTELADSAPGEAGEAGVTVGGLTNGTTYDFQVRAVNAGGASEPSDAARALAGDGLGICNRTPQVRDAILGRISGITDCAAVTNVHLAAITGVLGLTSKDITALKVGDFAGLTRVTLLALNGNALPTLPAGVFAGLPALEQLFLNSNALTTLPAGVFTGLPALTNLFLSFNELATLPAGVFTGLAALTDLYLGDNALGTLPAGVFAGLTSLTTLGLPNNATLATLPAGVFDDLTVLTILDLTGNGLTTLPAGVFARLAALTELSMGGNALATLPAGVFAGLASLTELRLDGNQLTALPAGIFAGLASLATLQLENNAVAPLLLPVTLERGAGSQFKAGAPTGAPFALVLPVSVTNGSLVGGAGTSTIPAGALESAALTVTRSAAAPAATTVDIGPLPALPSGHSGYSFSKAAGLPLTMPGLTVTPTTLTVAEEDATGDSYTVVLDTQPTADVVVTVAGHASTDVTPNPATLTFTSTTWSTAQPVTVTAGGDADTTDDTVTLTHSATSTDSDYDGMAIADVTVTVTDNDAVVTIAADATSALYAEDAVDFTLTRIGAVADPLAVTVTLTQSQAYLTAAHRSRTVVFLPDSTTAALQVPASQFRQLASGTVPEKGTLTATVAAGTGYAVGTTNAAAVDILIAATIRIEESSYTVSEEGGSPLTATVVVRTGDGAPQPTGTISVGLGTFATGSATSPEDYQVRSAFLNFRSSDFTADGTVYEARKALEITIHDDSVVDSGETFELRLQGAPGLPIKYWYNFVNAAGQRCGPTCAVTATITDTDTAGVTASTTTLTVDEGGTATYTVVLDTPPADTVTVTIGGTTGTDVSVADATLAFTTTDWSTAQTVTVSAVADADVLDDTVTLTHSATSTDSDYDGITIADVAVTVTEVPAPAKPTGLTATGGDEQVALAWDAPAATAVITHHEYRHKTALEEQYPETWTELADSAPGEAGEAGVTVGSLTNGTTYDFQVRAVNAGGASEPSDAARALAGDGLGICNRTPQVRDAILGRISGITDCAAVTNVHLAAITGVLGLTSKDITALKVGDFAGLTRVTLLALNGNALPTLPAGVFDGLPALEQLFLNSNALTTLPAGVFTGLPALTNLFLSFNELPTLPAGVFTGLAALTDLYLGDNALGTLPAGVFAGLTSLTTLGLPNNATLATLPAGVFDDLTALTILDLTGNGLTTLPAGVFAKLAALTELSMGGNALATLPAGVFAGLASLTELRLDGNQLTALPAGIFAGLASLATLQLENNAVAPLLLPVTLERGAGSQFKAVASTGAPFSLVLPVSVTNGSLVGGAGTSTIPAGALESAALTVTRSAAAAAATTVDIGPLPALPSGHSGYGFSKAAGLPLPMPGLTVTPTTLTVAEEGSGTYTVVLNTPPSATVTVTIGGTSGTDVSVNDATLAFTTTTWATAQTVTVSAAADADVLDDTVTLTHSATSTDSDYDGITIADVAVTVTEVPAPAKPTGLTATGGDEQVALAWDAPAATAVITHHEYRHKTASEEQYPETWTEIADSAPGEAGEAGVTVGSLTNGTTYDFQVRAVNAGGASEPSDAARALAGDGLGICNRTPQVRDAILGRISGITDCAAVTNVHLAAITGVLGLTSKDITALKVGDFAGLTRVTLLALNGNALPTLPAGVFDGLPALEQLFLNSNALTTLPAGVFTGLPALTNLFLSFNELATLPAGVFTGLAALTDLYLGDNALGTLPAGVFAGLTSLTTLGLPNNATLATLPAGVFDDLTALTILDLTGNGLTTLPAGVFAKLAALTELSMGGNALATLPAGVFAGLASLTELRLDGNQLTALPAGIFAGLASLATLQLENNAVDPLLLPVTLERGAGSQFKAVASTGAPFSLVLPVSVTNGSLVGGAGTSTIPAGALESAALTVTRSAAAAAATTVDIGPLPALPSGHSGYGFSKAAGLPLPMPGLTVTPTTLTVAEEGSGTYTVVLNTPPSATVTVTIGGTSGTDVSVNDATLAFTTTDWSTAQTVTVSAVADADVLDDTVTLTHSATSTDSDYDGITIADVAVTVTEVPAPAKPTGLTATGGDEQVALAWDAPAATAVITHHEYRHKTASEEQYPETWTEIADSAPGEAGEAGVTVGSLTNGTTYDLQVRAVNAGGASEPSDAARALAGDGLGICNRTPQVRDAILGRISGITDCAAVTNVHLAAITGVLGLTSKDITALKVGDFAGLTRVTLLALNGNALPTLPAGVFDGLPALEQLFLNSNALTTLPAGVFTGLPALTNLFLSFNELPTLPAGVFTGLAALTDLYLGDNALGTLPAGVFAGLTSLTTLGLPNNATLATLPAGVFDDLTALTILDLTGNGLTTLPAGVFAKLAALTELSMGGNALATLPAGVFAGLASLTELRLDGNQLTALPAGIFAGLASLATLQLENNAVAPLLLPVTLERGAGSQFKAGAPTGAPFALVLPVSVTNGSLVGGAGTSTIPAGALESAALTVTRSAAAPAATTVDIGPLPALPSGHSGYSFSKAAGLPLTMPGVTATPTTLTVAEEDATGDSYTVVLDTQPTADVVVTVAGHASTDVTPNPATLTFTSTTWSTAQPVTVTAGGDADTTDDTVTLTHSATSTDSDYDGMAIADVAVTVTDNDAVVTIAADATSALYAEDAVDFTLTRIGAVADPLAVTVTLTQSQAYLAAANLSRTVVFLPDSTTAALQVPASQFRQLASGTVPEKGTLTATVAAGTDYDVGAADAAAVDIAIAGTIGIKEASYTVSEERGSPLTVTVVARTGDGAPQPTGTIFVTLGTFATGSATSPEDYQVRSEVLRFRSSDFTADGTVYEAEKSVEITIHDDSVVDSGETFEIRLQDAPGLLTKYLYNFVNAAGQRCGPTCAVTATITDTDTAGVTASTTTLSVDEGGTATYTVVLDTQPAGPVTVTIGGTAGTDVTVNDSTLEFTTTTWSAAQTVTVSAAEDADGITDTVTLTHSATSTDSDYDGITIADVVVTVQENDTDLPALRLCGARLGDLAPYKFEVAVDICWETGAAIPTGHTVVLEARSRGFWDYPEPFSVWKAVARTACPSGSATCVQHTVSGLARGWAFTYEMRLRQGANVLTLSPQVRLQAPNSNASALNANLSDPLDNVSWRGVDVATGPFLLELAFTDPHMQLLATEAVQGLDTTDFAITNGTVTSLTAWQGGTYRVEVTPTTLGQPVTISLPANTVLGVGESITATGANTYTRNNTASNTITLQTAVPPPPGGPPLTAQFKEVPAAHDGQTPFTFHIEFSEFPVTPPERLRVYAIAATGGIVTRIDVWPHGHVRAVTIQPEGRAAVTVTLAAGGTCGEGRAVCTAGGRTLSTDLTASIAGPAGERRLRSAPLTARFEAVPAAHDGASVFALELAFSEPVAPQSRKKLQTRLAVAGGAVTDVRRVKPPRDRWRITVRPSSPGPVTITLPQTKSCDDPGAVCTSDGRTVTTAVATRIQGPPGLSIADAEVQEGPGVTLPFAVTLDRAASGPVTVAYATADGTATAGADYTATSGTVTFAAGKTKQTVPVTVLDDAHDEGRETLTLTLATASGAHIVDGQATGTIVNSDPLPQAWLGRFGRTVATHVTDAVNGRLRGASDSHVTVGGYRLPLRQRAVAAAATGQQAAGGGEPETSTEPETTTDRLASLLTELVGRALGLGPTQSPGGGPGTDPWADWPESDPRLGQSPTLQLPRLRDVLLGSSFQLSLGKPDPASGGLRLTAWGQVAGTRFDGRAGALTLTGDVLTGTVGVDGEWDRWLAGVAVAHSRGNGGYTMRGLDARGRGDLDTALTSIHPYLRYAVTERLDVWGLLGYGWGDLTLEPGAGATMETDTNFIMGAFGSRGILLQASDSGGFELATRTDAMLTRTSSDAVTTGDGNLASSEADAHRLRLVLEGSRGFTWPEGRTLTPTLEIGLRHDWGDAETGFGLELGGRVQYADPRLGLTIEGAVRSLLAHEDSDYGEWGASGSLRIDPGPTGQGLSLTLAPTWGAASSGVDGLWSRQTTAGLAPHGTRAAPTGRLNAEVSYGVAAPFGTGLLTPYAGLVLTDGADRTYRLGTRWTSVSGLTLNVEAQRQESPGQQPPNQGLHLSTGWGF